MPNLATGHFPGRPVMAAWVIVTAFASDAWACPYCDSAIGQKVAAGIFDGEFVRNVALTILPLAVLGVIVLLIHVEIPRRTSRRRVPIATPS